MKIFKKLIATILTIITILFCLIPSKGTFAATSNQNQVGQAIANTAIDFFNKYASETIYDYGYNYWNSNAGVEVPDCWGRKMAYKNIMTSGNAYRNLGNGIKEPDPYEKKFAIDCVGFVSMIVHEATGLGGSSFSYFGVPQSCSGNDYTHFDELSGVTPMAGDIICWGGHVAIAISSTEMIDSANAGPKGAITKRPILNYCDHTTGYKYTLMRIKSSVADDLVNKSALKNSWDRTPTYMASPASSESDIDIDVDDNSTDYEIHTNPYGDSEKFYYNGMPLSGGYIEHDDSIWIIEVLEDIADWLVGITTLLIKIEIIGWTSFIRTIILSVVPIITNESVNVAITAESILFNKITILDVNFFKFNSAAGEKIHDGDLVYELRQYVSQLYYGMRNLSIIIMLVILLYVGIRMALSTLSGDKAKYKRMLKGWLVRIYHCFRNTLLYGIYSKCK